MDFNLNQIAAAHFDGEGEKFVSIDLDDYRKFVSKRQIVRSSNIVVKKGGFAIGDSERAQVICEEHSCVRVFCLYPAERGGSLQL